MKKLHLNKTEFKILSMALQNDDRVQNHYSKEVFNCHYLSDYVSKLRVKLGTYFKDDGFEVIQTETHQVIKIDGSMASIGIYRVSKKYYAKIEEIIKNSQNQNPTNTGYKK